jgi:hypothetical protein
MGHFDEGQSRLSVVAKVVDDHRHGFHGKRRHRDRDLLRYRRGRLSGRTAQVQDKPGSGYSSDDKQRPEDSPPRLLLFLPGTAPPGT